MPDQGLAGSRIREKRLDRGLRQAAVAESVGISPSYLNLIEHNRRRIGGKLLADLARVLEVDTVLLADGVDSDTLDQMRGAVFLHYNPQFTSVEYPIYVSLVLIMLGLMGEFFARQHASLSWFAGR